jgi:MoxR-like ATPase
VSGLARYVQAGASPRGSIFLATAARALAFIRGRCYVVPQDVKELAPDPLRRRIITTHEADIDRVTPDAVIAEILNSVPIP